MTRGVANVKPREYTCATFGLVRGTDVPISPLDQSLGVWWLRVMMYIDHGSNHNNNSLHHNYCEYRNMKIL